MRSWPRREWTGEIGVDRFDEVVFGNGDKAQREGGGVFGEEGQEEQGVCNPSKSRFEGEERSKPLTVPLGPEETRVWRPQS